MTDYPTDSDGELDAEAMAKEIGLKYGEEFRADDMHVFTYWGVDLGEAKLEREPFGVYENHPMHELYETYLNGGIEHGRLVEKFIPEEDSQ
jgi:hypothetical protein